MNIENNYEKRIYEMYILNVLLLRNNCHKKWINYVCIVKVCTYHSINIFFSGGREVYSQSKARSGRHKNRQRQQSTEVIQHSNNLQQQQSRSIQDEIGSIHIDHPVSSVGGGGTVS